MTVQYAVQFVFKDAHLELLCSNETHARCVYDAARTRGYSPYVEPHKNVLLVRREVGDWTPPPVGPWTQLEE